MGIVEAVRLADRVQECIDTAKLLAGENFEAQMREYSQYIDGCMKKYGLEDKPSAIKKLLEIAAPHMDSTGEGVATCKLVAAAFWKPEYDRKPAAQPAEEE